MDTALELRLRIDNGEKISEAAANDYLKSSKLFNTLTSDFAPGVLNLLWRLTQLSEIPFAANTPKVKQWLSQLVESTYTGDGFSLNSTNDYVLACYNGMITSLLIRMQYPEKEKIETGIGWIMKYQNVKRNEPCAWTGAAIQKYGGCMKAVPCYIGIVKSMIALSDYVNCGRFNPDTALMLKLNTGLEYILNQEVYLRKSNGKPITSDITKLTYPFTYKINIIEVLRLLKANQLSDDTRCDKAKQYLLSKRKKDGTWWTQSVTINKNATWTPFDESRQPGLWITHEIERILGLKPSCT